MDDSKNILIQVTEVIKSIPEFMEAVTDLLKTSWGWLFLLLIVLWFLVNNKLGNIANFFERRKRHRLEKLESYITNFQIADENALEVMKDLRDAYYFKIATGIYAERIKRNSLINLHNIISPKLNWVHIKRAYPYIQASQDMNISIREMDAWEKFSHYYNQFVGYITLVFSAMVLIVFMLSEPKTIATTLIGVGGPLISALFSVFVFAQNWPYESAKNIRHELERVQNDQADCPTETS